MNTYLVRAYIGTGWSFITQSDHYEDFEFQTSESLEALAKRLAQTGFSKNKDTWIMPGAILEVRKL